MSFMAPEVVVLSKCPLVGCACVCVCMHARSCGGHYRWEGVALRPRGAIGWAATTTAVWVVQSETLSLTEQLVVGGWALQGHSFPQV